MKHDTTHEMDPMEFIVALRDSHPDIYRIFTEGSCFRFCGLLQLIFPSAEPVYSEADGHWAVKVGEDFYDIGGKLDSSYADSKDYQPMRSAWESAWVANAGNCAPYSKYALTAWSPGWTYPRPRSRNGA